MEDTSLRMACPSRRYSSKHVDVNIRYFGLIILCIFSCRVSQSLILGTTSIANSLAFTPNFTKGLEAARNIKRFLARVPHITDYENASNKDQVSIKMY